MRKYLIYIIFSLTTLSAQWSATPEENLQVSTFGQNPVACSDGAGGAYAFWTTSNNLWGRRIDRYGYLTTDYIEIPGDGIRRSDPKLLSDGQNNVFVAYREIVRIDTAEMLNVWKLKVQKLDTLGHFLWDSAVVVSEDSLGHSSYEIVSDGAGGIILLWRSFIIDFDSLDYKTLRGQRLSANGARLWGEEGILIHYPLKLSSSLFAVITDGEGGVIAEYREESVTEPVFQRIEAGGQTVWRRYSEEAYEYLSINSGGCLMLAGIRGSGQNRAIIANRMSLEGEFLWGESGFVVNDSLGSYSTIKDIQTREDSLLVIYWNDIFDLQYDYTAKVQFIFPNGELYFQQNGISVSVFPANSSGRRIIESVNSSTIYTWFDDRFGINDSVLFYSQKLDAFGNREWQEDDVLVSVQNPEGEYCFISDANGGYIQFWGNLDTGHQGIFAQQVSTNGNLGEIITAIDKPLPNNPTGYRLEPNYPNPFNPGTTIPISIEQAQDITIDIINIAGQRIRTLYNGYLPRGYHRLYWNGKNSEEQEVASGLYFVRVETGQTVHTGKMLLLR
jgi:hypothetical protein